MLSCIKIPDSLGVQEETIILIESSQAISDFSDFVKTEDNEYVTSENYISSINISYSGSESVSSSLEVFKLSAPDKKNFSDYQLEVYVDYQYLHDYDTGGFGCCIGPSRDSPIELNVNSDTITISDDSQTSYAKYEVTAFPNGKMDSSIINASSGMQLEGRVTFQARRIANNLTLLVLDTTNKTLVGKSWISGVDYDRNSIALVFQVEGTSNFRVGVYGITGEFTLLEIENTTTPINSYFPSFTLGMNVALVCLPICSIILMTRLSKQRKSK